MKEYIKAIILVLLSCSFIYLLGVFANATFDVTLWSDKARSIIATFMFFITIFVLLIYKSLK